MNQLQAEQTRANEAALQYETEKANRTQAAQILTKEVTHIIQKPAYRNCRLDADGLRLLAAAIYQANRASQPYNNVPNPSAAE